MNFWKRNNRYATFRPNRIINCPLIVVGIGCPVASQTDLHLESNSDQIWNLSTIRLHDTIWQTWSFKNKQWDKFEYRYILIKICVKENISHGKSINESSNFSYTIRCCVNKLIYRNIKQILFNMRSHLIHDPFPIPSDAS